MGLVHTIPKLIMTAGLVTGPIMLAAGLGLIDDVPGALIKANGGTGPDKAEWGAEFLGTTRAKVLILLGTCKFLAILDVWVLHVLPRLACLCVACMMGLVGYCHHAIDDELAPPLVLCAMAIIAAATWPPPPKKGKTN